MSLANRKKQYKMFMERGEEELAQDQIKAHPELLDGEFKIETPSEEKEEEPIKSKKRK